MLFLGYNQTFVGVLASLLVLCLALDSSNILHTLLKGTRKNISSAIKRLAIKVDGTSAEKFKDKSYKELERRLKKDKWDIEARRLKAKWDLDADEIIAGLKPAVLADSNNMLKHIDSLRLKVTAPLYSLLCSLVLFAFDAIAYTSPSSIDFIVSVSTIWLALSMILWTVLWIRCNEAMSANYGKARQKKKRNESRRMILILDQLLTDKSNRVSGGMSMILCVIVFASIFLLGCLSAKGNLTVCRSACLAGILAGPMSAALWMCCRSDTKDEYPYRHAIQHAVWLLLYSILTCLVVFAFDSIVNVRFAYTSTSLLTSLWCMFILTNGILLPCGIPYYWYIRTGDIAKRYVEDSSKEMKLKIESLNNTLSDSIAKDLKL